LIGRPYPDWARLTDEVQSGRVTADTVMRVAAVMFVAIWIWLVIVIASDVFRLLRTRGVEPSIDRNRAVQPARRTNSVLHRLVRIAVLGTVTTATTISTWPTAALATASPTLAASAEPPAPMSAPADPTEARPTTPSTTTVVADGRATPLSIAVDLGDESLRDDIIAMNRSDDWTGGVFPEGTVVTVPFIETTSSATTPTGTYVVQPNDGMWNVAEALLGDGSRHVELGSMVNGQEVAPGVIFSADTAVIHPGWKFQLPSEADSVRPTAHVVERGDTLSAISQRYLGDESWWPELWNHTAGVEMNDGRSFDDPNLILPGWQLVLPADDAVNEPTPVVPEAPPPPIEQTPDETDVATPTPAPTTVSVDDQVDTASAPLPPPTVTTPATRVVVAPTVRVTSPADAAISSTIDGMWNDESRSVWPGIIAGSLLAAGLAATIRRLRMRRLARVVPGERLRAPENAIAGTEHALLERADDGAHNTMSALLRSLTPHAAGLVDSLAVRAVQVGGDRIEVLFADPAPLPPQGWSTIDGGNSWTHRLDDVCDTHRQLITPALVTIGARTSDDADEVLLDVETAGSLTLCGDRSAALGLARSIVLELATYPLGVSMDVGLVGIEVPGAQHCDRTWVDTTIERAVRVARSRIARRLDEAETIVESRAQLDEDDGTLDPHVFVVDAAALAPDDVELLGELVGLCASSSGTAVVVVGECAGANERIVLSSSGTALWSGVELSVPDVTEEAAAEVEAVLEHVAFAEADLLEPSDMMAALLSTPDDQPDSADDEKIEWLDRYEPPAHDVVLQLMGEPRAHGVELTADETELLVLLACLRHRTEVHIGLIHDSVAPERARKTIENRMSILRRKLGVGSDHHDLLPEAASGRSGRNHYLVSPLVLTDVDLLEHRLHASEARSTGEALVILRDGLDSMNGPLLRARRGYEFWPHSEGVAAELIAVIQTYAARLIELAAEAEDPALVLRAATLASSVLDNPLAEFPIRQAEQAAAAASGDETLLASVEAARAQLLAHLDAEDPFAETA
ncbi:MAG: LysM peptidoglycan-binding domain-containing protein, partial [Actinomycetota bacterium]